MERRRTINYCCENESDINTYVFDTIFWLMGFKAKKVCASEEIDIYYGNNVNKNCVLSIVENAFCMTPDYVINGLEDIALSTNNGHKRIEFDFIYVIGMFLTDKINSNRTDSVFDIHGRLEYENAMQSKYSDPSMPLLNAYILSFKNIIINALQVKHMPLWPDNKKACIVLTHDVDNPDKYSLLKDYRIIPRKNTDRGVVSYNYHILKTLISYLKDRNKEENWLFNKVIEAESKYNFKSTFYFASRPYSNKNGHLFDVPYHIKKRKFKKLFEELNAYNVDIGLHASYNAHKDPNLFIEEKKWLEKLTKTEVCGLRHHYWHLGKELFDTLHYHEIAGFKYDTSIAFNNHPGYRFEVAFPFYPFDVVKNKRIDVLQLPPFLMDGSLFYKEDMTVEKGMEIINPYISNLLKYNGIGVVDWHVRTSFPSTNSFNSWGKFYLEFLDYLKSKQEVWVTNAKEVYDWLDKRNKQLIK